MATARAPADYRSGSHTGSVTVSVSRLNTTRTFMPKAI